MYIISSIVSLQIITRQLSTTSGGAHAGAAASPHMDHDCVPPLPVAVCGCHLPHTIRAMCSQYLDDVGKRLEIDALAVCVNVK